MKFLVLLSKLLIFSIGDGVNSIRCRSTVHVQYCRKRDSRQMMVAHSNWFVVELMLRCTVNDLF